ncbi:MAG: DUF4404 family protein [Gammaproteobacteria bacterium]|nr:DUF4404 family protein [Gammaproteobacteria bacterium]
MSVENLKKMLGTVHGELENTQGLAEQEEQSLRDLLEDIENRLDELDDNREKETDGDDFGERVTAAMGEFQASHPTLEFALRRLVDTLQKIGI